MHPTPYAGGSGTAHRALQRQWRNWPDRTAPESTRAFAARTDRARQTLLVVDDQALNIQVLKQACATDCDAQLIVTKTALLLARTWADIAVAQP